MGICINFDLNKKLMKKYKFVGDSSGWGWDSNPVKGVVYDEGQLIEMCGKSNWDAYEGRLIEDWDENVHQDNIGCWKLVTDDPSVDPLIEKLTNLDNLYLQMIGIAEELTVDLDEGAIGAIEKCSDPKKGLDLVVGLYKKHRELEGLLNKD